MQELENIGSNEAEPSGDFMISVGEFFGCIENKAYNWPQYDWPDSRVDTTRYCFIFKPIFVSVTNRILLKILSYVITKNPFSFQTKAKINHLSVIELVKTL